MKNRYLSIALFLVVSLCYSVQSHAQGTATLRVASMPGFPDLPADTAYEGQTYAFDLLVVNNSNVFINTTITFYMRVDSITIPFLSNPQPGIAPGDSLTVTVPAFNFSQPQYKMGNNIVVVWPVVSNLVVPIDSLITNVHFVPLSSLGSIDVNEPVFNLFPVPATNSLHIIYDKIHEVEYVRIFDVKGQLVKELPGPSSDQVDISFLAPGLYFLELESAVVVSRRKFLKEN